MNQTWMTGTPLARAACGEAGGIGDRVLLRQWAGEPEAAKAPPSITTSFCMSWTMTAQRPGRARSPARLQRAVDGDDRRGV
jgi:hypothetical protein